MRKIIFRYIFKEIAISFFMILFVLTFVLLMGKILQIMDLMVNKGVSFFSIAKIITFLLLHLFLLYSSVTISCRKVILRLKVCFSKSPLKTRAPALKKKFSMPTLKAFSFTQIEYRPTAIIWRALSFPITASSASQTLFYRKELSLFLIRI